MTAPRPLTPAVASQAVPAPLTDAAIFLRIAALRPPTADFLDDLPAAP